MTKKFIITYNINVDSVVSKEVPAYMADVKNTLFPKDSGTMKDFLGKDNVIEFYVPVLGQPTEIKVTTIETETTR